MKIIRAMRVARARARGSCRGRVRSPVSNVRNEDKAIASHGSVRETERDNRGNWRTREKERRLSDRRCGKERKGNVRQGRSPGIALMSASRTGLKRVTGV